MENKDRAVKDSSYGDRDSFQFGLPPEPTNSEIALRKLLAGRVPITTGKVVYYTLSDYFTPDILIGDNFIVEVNGSVHSEPHQVIKDRIRTRALQKMGYFVTSVSNEDIDNHPTIVVNRIEQMYNEFSKQVKSVVMKEFFPTNPIMHELSHLTIDQIASNLWKKHVLSMSIDEYEQAMSHEEPLLDNLPGDMEKVVLGLMGLHMAPLADGCTVDFSAAAKIFKISSVVVAHKFGESAPTGLVNKLLMSAPNLIKNIVLKGGPTINTGLVEVSSVEDVRKNIVAFNTNFYPLGVEVLESEAFDQCCASLIQDAYREGYFWLKSYCRNRAYVRNI